MTFNIHHGMLRTTKSSSRKGMIGKAFASEIARVVQSYVDSSNLESTAVKGVTLLEVLLLQSHAVNNNHVNILR